MNYQDELKYNAILETQTAILKELIQIKESLQPEAIIKIYRKILDEPFQPEPETIQEHHG